ncbi:MAG TPA: hypothetical protein VF590_13005 [Isosphaeraceae bacterium]|jgi:hypothetical protein
MRCRDFERLWNERLDARSGGSPHADRELEAHAAACPSCRSLAGRYRVLQRAIGALGPPPAPPADFAVRCLAAWERAQPARAPRAIRFRPPIPVPVPARWAAAAALLLVIGLAARSWLSRPHRPGPEVARRDPVTPPVPAPAPAPVRPLADAVADATAATLDLAWETSAPAARVGRAVLGDVAIPAATSMPLPVPAGPAPPAWNEVGQRVNAGFRPLSGSARHAFGFLLPPTLDPPQDAVPDPKTGA